MHYITNLAKHLTAKVELHEVVKSNSAKAQGNSLIFSPIVNPTKYVPLIDMQEIDNLVNEGAARN